MSDKKRYILIILIWIAVGALILLDPFKFLKEF